MINFLQGLYQMSLRCDWDFFSFLVISSSILPLVEVSRFFLVLFFKTVMLNLPRSDLANFGTDHLSGQMITNKKLKKKIPTILMSCRSKFSCILLLLWFSQPTYKCISDETNFCNLGSQGATMGPNHLWICIFFSSSLKLYIISGRFLTLGAAHSRFGG